MTIKIQNAKIRSRLFLSYGYTAKENEVENKIKQDSDAPIHEDLERAFDNLIPHFIIITEESEVTEKLKRLITRPDNEDFILPEDIEKKYKVTGISISGSEDNQGVTISGYKNLNTGKSVSFDTPNQKFDDEDYEFSQELYDAVEHLKSEVLEYMDGKHGTRMVVGTLDFNDNEDGAFQLPSGVTVEVSMSKTETDDDIMDPDFEDLSDVINDEE
ncbi:hypothetical protein [Epilithonimonas caeni]|uniref:hypothetical protein n=1 Tax=Epilithonimonas caeni TaxID=365343 RepID=UPI00041003D4|nr:hypothetical protein [Epilithonimonas caeni]